MLLLVSELLEAMKAVATTPLLFGQAQQFRYSPIHPDGELVQWSVPDGKLDPDQSILDDPKSHKG